MMKKISAWICIITIILVNGCVIGFASDIQPQTKAANTIEGQDAEEGGQAIYNSQGPTQR